MDLRYCSDPAWKKKFMKMVINLDNLFNVFYKSVPLPDPELPLLSQFDKAIHALKINQD